MVFSSLLFMFVYLPVVLANFATGNNSWNEKSRTENRGTGTAFMLRARVEDMDQLLLYTFYIVENPMLR